VKRISIQAWIGLLLTLAVILLSATCYLSYKNLSSIVSSIRIELTPELRLVNIHEISRDLETAGNSIRLYTITLDTSDLNPYYSVIDGIDDKINALKLECVNDSVMLNQADTISVLVEENIVNWNRLLYLINNDNVVEFLNHLSEKLNTLPDSNEKRGILKRVFSRNKSILNEEELKNDIRKIEEQGKINKERLREGEEQLASTSDRIEEKFFDLIARMEIRVSAKVDEKGKAANRLAESTYRWLLLFSVSGGLLLFLVLYVIIRYIRNANAYQVALEKSKSETENLTRTKELFMANISHEIRTPVTAISGFTEQLIHEIKDENSLRSLKIIKSSSDHLAKIIDDILDLSKLQNGKLKLEKIHFNISQVIDEACSIFMQQAEQKNIALVKTIRPGTPPVILGDPYRLKQILINLVGNAVKFTEKGSVGIIVEGITDGSGGVDLILDVADTGIGIDADKLDIIFEDFTQGETNTSSKYGGTGLGLSIVKKLINLQGGSIKCESKKDHGTKITCHLPLLEGSEDQVRRDVSLPLIIPEEFRKMKILIVDDEEYNRLLFKKILEKWQVESDESANAAEAVELLKRKRYNLLFMDIRMPGTDGITATKTIREELGISQKDMKVILISAGSPGTETDVHGLPGVNAFLQKPFTEEMLLMTIISVTGYRSQSIASEIKKSLTKNSSEKPGINLGSLRHISGGDDQFVKQMLDSFIQTTQSGLDKMMEAVVAERWEEVSELAHKMVPPCRHIGATALHDLFGKIMDTISKKADKQSVETLVTDSIIEFKTIRKLLGEYISGLKI
jgi:signal transduction histidine kinase/CheY-like chemotaxis protein/HPt (histidine-containing phosphotransfer) domain-containing protein/CHASE3 domain sensor protein